jgi:nitric oxide reductase activation protein
MFVISDGSPCAHGYHGYSAYEDVRSKVKKVEADGFDVIQISIDRINDVELMFDKHIYLRDLSKLHTELSQIVKKAVLSDKKTIVSTE